MKVRKEWFCPNCKKFIDSPNPAGFSIFGPVAEMSCDVCGNWLMEFTPKKGKK